MPSNIAAIKLRVIDSPLTMTGIIFHVVWKNNNHEKEVRLKPSNKKQERLSHRKDSNASTREASRQRSGANSPQQGSQCSP